jgi:hypothetical protein
MIDGFVVAMLDLTRTQMLSGIGDDICSHPEGGYCDRGLHIC